MAPERKPTGKSERTNIIIPLDKRAFLMTVSASIMKKSGTDISPSGIIRALIGGLKLSGFNVSGATSEEDLARLIGERMAGGKPKK